MIGLFKDSNQRQLGRVMAEVLAKRYTRESGCMPDIVVPVPLTKRKRRARGFNQAELIADVIAEAFADTSAVQTGKRVRTGLVVRRFDSQPQKSLDRAKRRTGPKGAFAVCDRIDGASVLIVDDVVTTGATVTELTQVLKNAGARAVTVAALARTPQRDSG